MEWGGKGVPEPREGVFQTEVRLSEVPEPRGRPAQTVGHGPMTWAGGGKGIGEGRGFPNQFGKDLFRQRKIVI